MTRLTEIFDGILNAFLTRMVLSVAIMLSLLVLNLGPVLNTALLVLFGLEAVLRTVVVVWQRQQRRRRRWADVVTLTIVVVATLSFLPLESRSADWLWMGRVARLLLLISYWGELGRHFIAIAIQRERLSQIMLVGGLAFALTAGGATILRMVNTSGVDFDGDGQADAVEPGFFDLIWWSFRQVEDPGNLVQKTDNAAVLLVSLGLTAGGLLLIAVLIGIGATLVEDLVRSSRARRVGLKEHTVVLNVAENSLGVLANVTEYFTKQLRLRRVAVQGRWEERPAFLDPLAFRKFEYRGGRSADTRALEILDVGSARRIAVLASGPDAESDANAVTAVLSARLLNERAWIVVELNKPGNIPAALKAGQRYTVPVPARRLAALVLGQELVDPGRAGLLQDLVSLAGHEIYTCILNDGRLAHLPPTVALTESFHELRLRVLKAHRCLLIGYIEDCTDRSTPWLRDIVPILNPPHDARPQAVRGLIAIAPRFDELQAATEDLYAGRMPAVMPRVHASIPIERVEKPQPKHIMVLGFHDDTVELVGELLRIFHNLEVTIVGQDEAERARIRKGFLSERTETGASFEAPGHKRLQLTDTRGSIYGSVNIRVGDRYADGLFKPGDWSGPVGNVFDYDAVVLLAERTGPVDADAGTTLGVLKLLDEWTSLPADERRLGQVVAELADPTKARLLRERVSALGLTDKFSFVCTSSVRDDILSHSFFVPGLPPILHNLMTAGEEELFAYQPTTRDGDVMFGDLVDALGSQSPALVPLAAEVKGKLVVNPKHATRLAWDDVETIYCLGTLPDA